MFLKKIKNKEKDILFIDSLGHTFFDELKDSKISRIFYKIDANTDGRITKEDLMKKYIKNNGER